MPRRIRYGRGMRYRVLGRGHTHRQPIVTHYAETGNFNNIGFGTTINASILRSQDSPDKTVISNIASIAADCENNSKIIKKGSFLRLLFRANTQAAMVGIWVYRNAQGFVTAPTDTTDFNEGPQTEDNAQLREHTIYYRRMILAPEETRSIRIPLWSRRNNFMNDGTQIRLVLQNFQLVSGSIDYGGYGRIRTVSP